MSTSFHNLSNTGARAKRTHARRSCDLCKVRKTRCELPDLDIPSSSDALPTDKACHRCKVLALPCVVEDSSRKQRKRSGEEAWTSPNQVSQSSPKRRLPLATSSRFLAAEAMETNNNGVNHSLDLIHGFHPADATNSTPLFAPSSAFRINPDQQAENGDSHRVQSMRFHGRPLVLVCAMLRVAYGKNEAKISRQLVTPEEVDLGELADHDMRARLEPGVSQLRTFHPYLEPLHFLFEAYLSSPSSSSTLLLSVVLYLASLSLPPDQAATNLRTTLTPYIISLRDTIMLQLPESFLALKALDLLLTHAPLGALPLQLINPRLIGVAAGQSLAATHISESLAFPMLFKQINRGHCIGAWDSTDVWLYISLRAAEASIALEAEVTKRPAGLSEARDLAEAMMAAENADTWRRGLEVRDPAEVLGKLAVCDRLARLGQVHDGIARIRGAMDAAAAEPNLDLVEAVVEELKYHSGRLEAIDSRFDALLAIIAPAMSGISRSWMAYRRIRQHFEANKVHVTALRILMATVYLPGTPGAFPGLPNDFTPVQKVAYAISRASNPQDILPFLVQSPPTPAVLAVWEWGRHRGDVCEQILVGIAELGGDFVPFHDVVCIAVECAKVLMEMEAVAIVVKRSGKALDRGFRIPTWFYLMKQVSQVLRGIGQLTADDEEGSISIPKGCSNLVGSMVRMAAEWAKTLEAEEAAAPSGSMAEDPQQPVKAPYWNGNGYGQDVGNNCQHQRYMNTSDRWMATDHNAHGGSYSQSPAEWQAAYPPTAIDLLLSEMFNYSSQPQGQPVSAQALSGGDSGQALGYGKAPK